MVEAVVLRDAEFAEVVIGCDEPDHLADDLRAGLRRRG